MDQGLFERAIIIARSQLKLPEMLEKCVILCQKLNQKKLADKISVILEEKRQQTMFEGRAARLFDTGK